MATSLCFIIQNGSCFEQGVEGALLINQELLNIQAIEEPGKPKIICFYKFSYFSSNSHPVVEIYFITYIIVSAMLQ